MNTLEFLSFVWLADRMVPFIREYHPKWRDEPAQKLYDYLAWHAGKKTLAVDCQGEEIYGVCTIKLFDQLDDFLDPRTHNPTGRFVMVDLLVAVSPVAIAHCFDKLVYIWGPRHTVIWERGERTENGCPRIYRWDQFMKLTRRISYGLAENAN
jgi:hypothetical protein